jgi:hypothetical protein
VQEDKANAHVDTFDEPPTAVPLGVFRQTVEISTVVSPFSGRGSFAFILHGHCRASEW